MGHDSAEVEVGIGPQEGAGGAASRLAASKDVEDAKIHP
jgi:hypothetical protein